MNKTELTRLKGLAEKATKEPWDFVQKWDEWENYVGPESWVDDGQWIGVFKYSYDADFVRAANPQTILAMIAEIERLQDENQYLRDWAKIDIDASKASLAFEEELASILGIDPDAPERARRSEIMARVAGLEKEADWLAEHHYERDEISQRILGEEYVYTKEQWRESARKAVEGK